MVQSYKGKWVELISSDRSVLRPLTPDFLPSLAARTSERINEWLAAALSAATKAAQQSSVVAGKIVDSLEQQYSSLLDARTIIDKFLDENLPMLRQSILVPPDPDRIYEDANFSKDDQLSLINDQLYWDHQSLVALAKQQSDNFLSDAGRYKYVINFLDSWVKGSSTPLRIIQQVQGSLSLEVARARLLTVVDFSSLREEIDAHIKNLIPHSSELTYAFDLALEQNAAKSASGGFFEPQEGCNLTITSKTKIDFIEKTAQFRTLGALGPFNIKLLGNLVPDVLTLMFDGVTFESTGGPVHCDVKFRDFKIGKVLKFLEVLQTFLTPKKGSGFYIVPLSGAVGVEAGYGLNLGTISLATISFFNVSLNAAVRLPFDEHEATFVTSLSRRDAPFTISAAPYGGSGFFSLEANARGVIGFEASFEYGGAAAFHYGPLEGSGRLMIGAYIRKGTGGDRVAATFYAGGSASIWIFSFGASLYIAAESEPSKSQIVGTATFTFSFSIGLADYDFRVNVRHELDWGGGSGGGTSSSSLGKNGAGFLNARAFPKGPVRKAHEEQAEFRADSWCQSEHWGHHRDHFNIDLDVDVQEFA